MMMKCNIDEFYRSRVGLMWMNRY